ncbi:rho GDP-dissociation inhibitor 1-like, partial [Coregonus clupeaformis]|uniref:rho GDP-dissociation inhibitor 1-like n=1 Tax=Coregonus clupeaformis TaxID=59861 RepID=UPI001E1C2ACB
MGRRRSLFAILAQGRATEALILEAPGGKRQENDMAEDDLTPEQLAAIAAENDVGETVNYKPPAQKTLQEIQELDQDDESLRKYKEVLLGAGAAAVA